VALGETEAKERVPETKVIRYRKEQICDFQG